MRREAGIGYDIEIWTSRLNAAVGVIKESGSRKEEQPHSESKRLKDTVYRIVRLSGLNISNLY